MNRGRFSFQWGGDDEPDSRLIPETASFFDFTDFPMVPTSLTIFDLLLLPFYGPRSSPVASDILNIPSTYSEVLRSPIFSRFFEVFVTSLSLTMFDSLLSFSHNLRTHSMASQHLRTSPRFSPSFSDISDVLSIAFRTVPAYLHIVYILGTCRSLQIEKRTPLSLRFHCVTVSASWSVSAVLPLASLCFPLPRNTLYYLSFYPKHLSRPRSVPTNYSKSHTVVSVPRQPLSGCCRQAPPQRISVLVVAEEPHTLGSVSEVREVRPSRIVYTNMAYESHDVCTMCPTPRLHLQHRQIHEPRTTRVCYVRYR